MDVTPIMAGIARVALCGGTAADLYSRYSASCSRKGFRVFFWSVLAEDLAFCGYGVESHPAIIRRGGEVQCLSLDTHSQYHTLLHGIARQLYVV